jgi:Tripartite tricarboxylate transporter family receptor
LIVVLSDGWRRITGDTRAGSVAQQQCSERGCSVYDGELTLPATSRRSIMAVKKSQGRRVQTPAHRFSHYESSIWYGVVASAATLAAILNKPSAELAQTFRLDDLRERMTHEGLEHLGSTPTQFHKFMVS